jgi:hypothetical protein
MSPTLVLSFCGLLAWSVPVTALAGTGPGRQPAASQTPSPRIRVTGLVVDVATGRPIAGAHLTAGDETTTTTADGRFALDASAGTVTLVATAAGYHPSSTIVDAGQRRTVDLEFALAADTGYAERLDIVAVAPTSSPTAETVRPVDVLRTPGALDNVFRTLQTLPGVMAADELGSRLAVRGGTPDQNLTMMDGVEVHDPFRLFGLASAFNPETIEKFELATGGFSVKYGDRLASLLVVENRDGRPGRVGGTAALSATDGNVVLEGGLPGRARGSWLATARRTYYDLVAERFVDQGLPGFQDVQARGQWLPSDRSHVTVFGLRSRQAANVTLDEPKVTGSFRDDTANDLGWTRLALPIGRDGTSQSTIGWSRTHAQFGFGLAIDSGNLRSNSPSDDNPPLLDSGFDYGLRIDDRSFRQEVGWVVGAHAIDAGFDVHALTTRIRFAFTGDRNPIAANGSSVQGGSGLPDLLVSTPDSSRGSVWLQDTWHARTNLTLQAGVRVDRSSLTRQTTLSPRVTASWVGGHGTTVTAATGLYTQSPGYEKLSNSDYMLDLTHPEAGRLSSERAWLTSVAVEQRLPRGFTVKAEGYLRRLDDLIIGRLEPEAERLARVSQYDFPADLLPHIPSASSITVVPANSSAGRAHGFDVMLSRTAGARVSGWASYTWGRAIREAYGREYPFEYDRRHAFTAVGALQLTPRWSIGTTARVASGFPYTAPLGVRVVGIEDRGDGDLDGNTDELVPRRDAAGLLVYAPDLGTVADLRNARLPVFARVDLRVTWRPRGMAGRWELYAEALNLLNRQNASGLDPRLEYDPTSDRPRVVEKPIGSIPLLPTIGVRFRF